MKGIDRNTGRQLGGLDHLRQSIADILSTPLGSRVMRRDYGSRLFELVDRPLNDTTRADMHAATAEALIRWEPRIAVTRVTTSVDVGSISITVEGQYLPNGQIFAIDVPLR